MISTSFEIPTNFVYKSLYAFFLLNKHKDILARFLNFEELTINATNGDAGAKADAGTIAYYNSIIGSDFYAENAVQTVTPVWDVTTMISVLGNDGTCKLVGDASSNPAFGNGMTVAALSALATDVLPASVLTVDQLGNARTDADKIIGACVK